MSGIMLWDGKILFRRAFGSKIAISPACCCEESSSESSSESPSVVCECPVCLNGDAPQQFKVTLADIANGDDSCDDCESYNGEYIIDWRHSDENICYWEKYFKSGCFSQLAMSFERMYAMGPDLEYYLSVWLTNQDDCTLRWQYKFGTDQPDCMNMDMMVPCIVSDDDDCCDNSGSTCHVEAL